MIFKDVRHNEKDLSGVDQLILAAKPARYRTFELKRKLNLFDF